MFKKNRKQGMVRGHSKNKNAFFRGGVVLTGKFEDVKMRVMLDTSKMQDKRQKYESSKKHEKKVSQRAKIAQFLRIFS